MSFELNRYDARQFVAGFKTSKIIDRHDGAIFSFAVEDDYIDEFEVYFPVKSVNVTEAMKETVISALSNLTCLDNFVQQYSEYRCEITKHGKFNYELYPSYLKLDGNTVRIIYYGMHVNTELRATFGRDVNGNWQVLDLLAC